MSLRVVGDEVMETADDADEVTGDLRAAPLGDMRNFSNSPLIGVGPAHAALAKWHLPARELWRHPGAGQRPALADPATRRPAPIVRINPRAAGGA